MITFASKSNCCGCEACSQICPKSCIQLHEDEEGFIYPYVKTELCVNCGLCERICPINTAREQILPKETYCAINTNRKVVRESSSGGVFLAIAEQVINKGGIVFGASFNEHWEVSHKWASETASLNGFKGSKYVQSRISNAYREVYDFLRQGKYVLFSGTPCQISALKSFLKIDYDNLLTVEVACHGVPSPKIYRNYLNFVSQNRIDSITSVSFRDKKKSWLQYRVVIKAIKNGKNIEIVDDLRSDNIYLQSFLNNYNLRPSCYNCSFKSGRSHADITLADFWGVWNVLPTLDYSNGASAVLINTIKGKTVFGKIDIQKQPVNYSDVVLYNSCLVKSSSEPSDRKLFWEYWARGNRKLLKQLLFPSKKSIVKRIIDRFFK